ncbi:MAG: hypothetical protein J6W84_03525 [Bacteroidales bacterium]|nr:hypothetical protein [Bacteroidales bacterium]
MDKQIHFDPNDMKAMIAIMDKHGNSDTMYPGTNENGETVFMSVYPEHIVVSTMQDNGWNRINTYWRDGTHEETFDGKWR